MSQQRREGHGPDPVRDARAHFEALHRSSPDPWDFASSWYERRKYAITLASLPRRRYGRAWEPGCSIGELTVLLSQRTEQLHACDASPTAVLAARRATALQSGVTVSEAILPSSPPATGYDLVVMSEVLYYLSEDDREQTLRLAEAACTPDADLVVVHWRHHPDDAWAAGAQVNADLRARPGWRPLARHDDTDFVLDVLTRA